MKKIILLCLGLLLGSSAFAQFDHSYSGWDALTKKHVKWLPDTKGWLADATALAGRG